jgi:hypothetical protein
VKEDIECERTEREMDDKDEANSPYHYFGDFLKYSLKI